MSALVRMRLAGFLSGGRVLLPLLAVLVELGVIHGGGASPAAVAYSYSAIALFPVLAWQTKLLLDTEPDVQRHLMRTAVGARREAAAGLLAAGVLALLACLPAMIAPWLLGGIDRDIQPVGGTLLGVLAHLLAIPPAVAVGALAARAVTRSVRTGVTVLVTAVTLVIVLGLQTSVAPWLVPPVMATARAFHGDELPSAGTVSLLGVWAAGWSAVALAGYARLRRTRS